MPQRGLVPWEKWRAWSRTSSQHHDTLTAEVAAMREHETMSVFDIEACSVNVRMPNREEFDFYAPPESPFVLRVLDTPLMEFREWQAWEGTWQMEPRWYVRVMRDPLSLAQGAGTAGALAYVYARTYLASRRYQPAPASAPA